MIRVTHNGSTETREAKSGSLGELVQQLLASRPEPSVATRLCVNGDAVPAESLEELHEVPIEGLEELELESEPVRAVAVRSLESAADFARQVQAALCRSAALMRSGEMDDALALYTQGLDGVSVLLFVVDSVATNLGEPAAPLTAVTQDLQPWLETLTEAQERADWIQVADCLQYELAPLLGRAGLAAEALHRGTHLT